MFCNICFNSRITQIAYNKVSNLLDRIRSSHYALLFRAIHVLQRKLLVHLKLNESVSNAIIRIEN